MEIVLPVPLHPKKMRQRGFNQSFLLIKDWEKIRFRDHSPHGQGPIIEKNVLARTQYTQPQASLSLPERRRNLREAFQVTDPDRIRNRHLLLVDDVMTSGGTVESCARTLLKAGARRVDVLTLARAL